MAKGSLLRQMKRKALREQGKTWTQRVMEAIRTGKPVQTVTFNFEGKKLIKA